MTDTPTIRLYDTMRREKVPFEPLDPRNVRMYVCGPTVYDHAHIGNARPAIVFDVLFRLLRHVYGEDHVTYVRNITDVDDKIIDRARQDFPDMPLNDAIRHVTETTTKQYQDDMAALGCLPPTHEPRATENIPQMIALVEQLLRNGHAYEATGPDGREVLFDVTSMPDYGALSNRRVEDQRAGARIEAKDHKRNPGDFVLWKEAKGGEPGWDSPFGHGRPGWHLECSAMSERLLGKTFDIHGGGIDLTFPHHENEIAQTRCAHNVERMANIWMHNGYLQVEGKKMSKSEGNFITVHDLLHTDKFGGRKWPGEVLRLAMLMTHYREPLDFTVKRLDQAVAAANNLARSVEGVKELGVPSQSFLGRLADDFNSASALNHVFELHADWRVSQSVDTAREIAACLQVLGLVLSAPDSGAWTEEAIAIEVANRLDRLEARDFATADTIRGNLKAEGIHLMDYKDPETGERRTKWELRR